MSAVTHSAALTAADWVFLEATVEWAQPALFHTSPNPAVGCLLVRGHDVIGRGRTEPAGGRHAEIVALDDARAHGLDPAGATAYVSLEPCAFEGRTPPCADALVRAGLEGRLTPGTRVVYVSPLKALSNDVERNLTGPLAEIQALAAARGLQLPPIRVGLRTGDTTPRGGRRRSSIAT